MTFRPLRPAAPATQPPRTGRLLRATAASDGGDLERRVRLRTRALAIANEELEHFTASVSHDLRAPLAVVRNFADLLLERGQLGDAERAHAARIAGAAAHMAEMIDALLALARVGRESLLPAPVDLDALVREVADECRDATGRTLDVQVHADAPLVADPVLLRVLLSNLLGNAWKFTRDVDQPRVQVTSWLRGGTACIRVADNGAGFDPHYAHQLFQPFRRLHTKAEFPGLGIGLATVHRIAQRHGGSVHAQGAPGAGAVFLVELPAAGPDLAHGCAPCELAHTCEGHCQAPPQ